MKTRISALILSICFVTVSIQLFSQENKPFKPNLLTYIESSAGLSNPEWEGGKTELEFADMNGYHR